MIKKSFDFFSTVALLLLLSPVLLFISFLIKCTSPGPILFRQKRVGLHRQEFEILKFRTMYTETPKNMPTHLLENPEKFITPIGKLLRKSSLDELPQLFNVVKGEMSLVGPRPALYNQYDLIQFRDKYNIHKVSPGITGWAQINGRDELDIPIKVEYDRFYVENQSFYFDVKILLLTVFRVFLARGVVEGKQPENRKHNSSL